MTAERSLSWLDQRIIQFEQLLRDKNRWHALRTPTHPRANPAQAFAGEAPLSPAEKQHIARLMRINHTGEICAQALYLGQAVMARDPAIKAHLLHSAEEEADHLTWCAERITELGGHTSYWNAFWYSASFLIGMIAACAGDAWSLGFIVETEHQVEAHLEKHRAQITPEDFKTHAILAQMQTDEVQHAHHAQAQGGMPLPTIVCELMRLMSQVMVATA